MTEPALLRKTVTTRRLNDLIWKDVDRDRVGSVAFFCECGREGCYLPVWLTPLEYERRRRRPDWAALAWSHREAAPR